MYLNEIKLIGFVGQDAELKSPQNSKELVRFDVATKASWKNRESGEYDKEVGKAKDTVKMPVAEIHAGEIRRLDPKASEDGAAA